MNTFVAERVLVVSPHPDDETLGCGGALRLHAKAGDEIGLIFLTSGEAGGHDVAASQTARIREREARAVADDLGASEVQFWRLPDGRLTAHKALVIRLTQEVRRYNPDTLYVTHEAEQHPDHRAASRMVRRAVLALPQQTRPRVLMFEVWTPLADLDELVDISDVMAAKLSAIRKYESQCRVMRFDEAFAGLARYRGEMHSWPGGDHAEAFKEMGW
jgi:LmbE family N-acetylglucosaminyl deacetylase